MNEASRASPVGPGRVLIPTYAGHLDAATELVRSIRECCGPDLPVTLVIGADERPLFADLATRWQCSLLDIETLVRDYTGRFMPAAQLLKLVDRFRYQALKKLLGIARFDGDVVVLDSESHVLRDLAPMFAGSTTQTTVAYSVRPWHQMPRSLTTEVYEECCHLLGAQGHWFFESFNWLYSAQLVRDMLEQLAQAHGREWPFRPRPLFECQLYFQYVHQHAASRYRFLPVQDILAIHFGAPRAAQLLETFFRSPRAAFGVLEYLARFLTRDEYAAFASDPEVVRHLRLVRHEPAEFYDLLPQLRASNRDNPHYLAEASMHRRPLLDGRIAVIVAGRFHGEQDVYNVRRFLEGVHCDLFLAVERGAWLESLARDVLQPRGVAHTADEAELGRRHLALEATPADRERELKPERDIGSMAMFDKIAAGWQLLKTEEAERGSPYAAVVRLRPDLFASRGLRDVLWDISEHTGSMAGRIFVPDRFWSQGINDQVFLGLRDEMGKLLDGVTPAAFAASSYRNPEFFLGTQLRRTGLQPVAFPLEYILTRGDQPDLHDIEHRWRDQERIFWSGPAPVPHWKDAGVVLDRLLANTQLKNGRMRLQTCPAARGPLVECGDARGEAGQRYLLLAEHKSPRVYLLRLPRWLLAIAPAAIAAGVLRPRHGREVALHSYAADGGELVVSELPSTDAAAGSTPDERAAPRLVLHLQPSKRSPVLAALRLGHSGLRAIGRLGRRALRT
ncbi:MAG TPA: hypothetical protein VHL79_13535 [Ramlibacter sp.]|jgi:hypothetical protein|nr:hypothetical protein [Ramlibacter sp.]